MSEWAAALPASSVFKSNDILFVCGRLGASIQTVWSSMNLLTGHVAVCLHPCLNNYLKWSILINKVKKTINLTSKCFYNQNIHF